MNGMVDNMVCAAWRGVFLLCAFLLAGTAAFGNSTQGDIPELEVSLLTCSPGDKVYSLYGHTALRVRVRETEEGGGDVVFNYGVFSFDTPHFVWRFTLGKCDYMVATEPFAQFARNYEARGSFVVELTLNLTQNEAYRLLFSLIENTLPENCTYRYNYLTNNCTTKVRDMVAACIDGTILLDSPYGEPQTYRQTMHAYTEGHPWAELGNDILLGAECDTLLSCEAEMFLPFRLMMYFSTAQIEDTLGNVRPLVSDMDIVAGVFPEEGGTGDDWCITPFMVAIAVLCLTLAVAVVEWRTRRMWWGVDAAVMTATGLAGCLLCFMFLFSQHPTLSSNWQVWVLNPLPLLCMPWVVVKAMKQRFCLYHCLSAVSLTAFIVSSPWIPQDFCEIIVPLAFVLLIRNVSYIIYYSRRR